MFYKIPRTPIVNRYAFLKEFCRDRNVLHLGACQGNDSLVTERFNELVQSENYLHTLLGRVARSVVGIDYNQFFIDKLRAEYGITNIRWGDLEKGETLAGLDFTADVIVFGEILEHLSSPARCLENVRQHLMTPTTSLAITVPNGLAFFNFFFALAGWESHDPDHSLVFTPRILSRLLEKNGFTVTDVRFYQPEMRLRRGFTDYYARPLRSIRGLGYWLLNNLLLRISPALAEGLIVVARTADSSKG